MDVQAPTDTAGWEVVSEHPFIGMRVAISLDGEHLEGTVAAIWEYEGDPRRLDVDVDGRETSLNVSPDSNRVTIT